MLLEESTSNVRRSWFVLAGFIVVVLAVAYGLGAAFGAGVAGLIAGAVVAIVLSLVGYLGGDAIVLRLSRAREVSAQEEPRLHNVVEGLAITAGIPKPRVFVVDDAAPNAFATGRDPAHATIGVTRGMLDTMNRVELEAVIAHELAHVKSGDTLAMALAVTLVGLPATVLPFIGPVLQTTVSPRREFYADLSGVQMTRFPPGLISALEKLKARTTEVQAAARATEPLWIESPLHPGGLNRWFDTHPPLDERIKLLREL
ncbi:MAG TPA: M48 family metallopeptidase [Actinomycetota bacterium]|nr:M48 family metallopeptidase [Actinomycetota bacterium]